MHDKRNIELNLGIAVAIGFFLHAVIAVIVLTRTPVRLDGTFDEDRGTSGLAIGRDVIVNLAPDDKKDYSEKTLLSDRDSSAQGKLTEQKGDTWLNNSREFRVRGQRSAANAAKAAGGMSLSKLDLKQAFPLTLEGATIFLASPREYATFERGDSEWTKVPDIKGINRNNALYYSNAGTFSFNTAKFKDFAYFHRMKNKIGSNWYPPVYANSTFIGYGGLTKYRMVQSQEVVLYFRLNRAGDVLDVVILDSRGYEPLNTSCIDAIRESKNFGPLPEDIKGDAVNIPFIFGFYVN